jgi:hypothetical protein
MMRTLMIVFVAASLLATPALADRTYEYSWNDDSNTILGTFDNCTADLTVTYNMPLHAGNGVALTKTTDVNAGYSTAFFACVWGLLPGDHVTASYWRYDPYVGYPRMRLWAHFNDGLGESDYRGQDLDLNDGLAYGNNSFGAEAGWEHFEYTWTIPADHTGLVIDAVLYGEYGATLYVDELSLTVPDNAYARVPGTYYDASGTPTASAAATWSNVKALFQ